MNWCWVSHKKTLKEETGGNYTWSPAVNKDSNRNVFATIWSMFALAIL